VSYFIPVGVSGDATVFCREYSYPPTSGTPSGTTGTPELVPRLIEGLLELRRKSFEDSLIKSGEIFSRLFEKLVPAKLAEDLTNVLDKLLLTEMLDPESDHA
ncbi:MAG TPA: hypothetical protein PLO50_14800, partial [Nitrospira sp.]|nr:hypothetical protein [Nitrospira sp.]